MGKGLGVVRNDQLRIHAVYIRGDCGSGFNLKLPTLSIWRLCRGPWACIGSHMGIEGSGMYSFFAGEAV